MSSWIGGLDVHKYVTDMMNKELYGYEKGVSAKMQSLTTRQSSLTTQLSAYGNLQSLLTTFQSNMSSLTSAFNPSYQVTSSNSDVVTAQAISGSNSAITAGSHTMTVQQLAQAQSLASGARTTSDTALGVTNTLNFSIGSSSFSLNVGPTQSLQSIAESINASASANNVGVTASVISTGSGSYRLMVSGNETGFNNRFTITETGTGANSLDLAYTPSETPGVDGAGTATQLTKAVNALFTFDGLSFSKDSNHNIEIGGLNVNLASVSVQNQDLSYVPTYITANATSLVSGVTKAMQTVVDTYNQIDLLIEKTQAVSGAQDGAFSMVLSSLQSAMKMSVGSGTYTNLESMGVTNNNNPSKISVTMANGKDATVSPLGLLKFDSTAFADAMSEDIVSVKNVLTNSTSGIATAITNMLVVNGAITNSGYVTTTLTNTIKTVSGNATDMNDAIADENQKIDDLKVDLTRKYAILEMSLQEMQNTSIYLDQQIAMMSK